MLTLLDWIIDLFRNEDAARAFVAAPDQTMRDAGFAGVSAAQVSSIAATAVPGLVLGGGDPIVGLQRAVSNQYGFASAYEPTFQPVYAPSPTFAPQTDTSLLSPHQDAGANAQQGAFNLGFGDITFGNKTTNTATNGGVVVDGHNHGDIVSGDGAVLGNGNDDVTIQRSDANLIGSTTPEARNVIISRFGVNISGSGSVAHFAWFSKCSLSI
jgi:hypothetical protein